MKSFKDGWNNLIAKIRGFSNRVNFSPLKKVINWFCDLFPILMEEIDPNNTEEEMMEEVEEVIQEQIVQIIDTPEASTIVADVEYDEEVVRVQASGEEDREESFSIRRGLDLQTTDNYNDTMVNVNAYWGINDFAISVGEDNKVYNNLYIVHDTDLIGNKIMYMYDKDSKVLLEIQHNGVVCWRKEGYNGNRITL